MLTRILITGGAGFVGSNLCLLFRERFPDSTVIAFDNLKRRGGELNLPLLQKEGVTFIHGDIRCMDDLLDLPDFDLLIDCAAEPSVQAGIHGSPMPVIGHNLTGTLHLIELARQRNAAFLFLSTSRVYPIATLNELAFEEEETRFAWTGTDNLPGFSSDGIAEAFPLTGARSLYGATKLAGELLLQEYCYSYNMPALINRCGILTGPRQMGKVDQGVVTLWLARHLFGKPLKYIGYGGTGKQVRDMLHVADLFELLVKQIGQLDHWKGQIYNVGGGLDVSASLLELTTLCQTITGNEIEITAVPETSPVDLRLYITDAAQVRKAFDWAPTRDIEAILRDIHSWILENKEALLPVLG